MRHAIIADVHANAPALTAVLAELDSEGVNSIVSLGDLVGYHAQPHEVISSIRARGIGGVVGNHDRMATMTEAPLGGPLARAAMLWTRRVLSDDEMQWLRELPTEIPLGSDAILVHTVPWSLDVRLIGPADFAAAAARIRDSHRGVRIVFNGHTHVAGYAHVAQNGAVSLARNPSVKLATGDGMWFINPGSVGLPRDGTAGAPYAIYDDAARHVAFRCAAYDMEAINQVNRACGLMTRVPEEQRPASGTPVAGIGAQHTWVGWA